MVHYCCVPNCRGKCNNSLNFLRFHSFPKNGHFRTEWHKAIKCQRPPSDSMKVCSRHFEDNDYTVTLSGFKRLKKDAIPSLLLPSEVHISQDRIFHVSPLGSVHSQPEVTHHLQDPEIELSIDDSRIDGMHFKQDLTASSFVDHVMSHHSTLYFLSGISKNAFESLLIVLTEKSAPIPSSCLSVQDQLLLTLCRYKHNFCHPLLTALFRSEINEIEVLNIFTFWTYHMYKKLMQYLAESVKLKNTGRMCLRVDVVRVPALKELPHQSKKEEFGDNSFLKSLVVIDTDNKAVLYCSQFYHATYGAMMQDSEFLECVAPSSLIKEDGSLNLSQLFPDKIIEIVCSDNYSVCPYLSEHGQSGSSPFSHFVKSKRSQCFVDTFKMLSDGLTMDISLMASQIMFNCMMLLNINENLSNT